MGTSGTFWIDIEDSAGNRVGPGPITTAEGWQWSPRLDEAGTFRFRMPASDPMAAHLVEKRIVRCHGIVNGTVTTLGAGIIEEIGLDVGDPSMVEVSGSDLLAELSHVSVKQLRICEQGWALLTDGRGAVHRIRVYWDDEVEGDNKWRHEDAPRYKMFDGDFGTHDNIVMYRYTHPHIGYLYVGHDARFDRARFTIVNRPNNVATTLHAQYFNGTEWTDLTIADGTESGGVTMAQSGTVSWTRPTDWVRNTPTSTAGDWFWVRFTVGEGTSTLDSFRIEEVEVYADIPTKNGVNLIMQYAPAGWATSGYPTTEAAHYIEFDGESILTALTTLVEQGGQDGGGNPIREHFRLGSGRTLTWLGTTLPATGLRAVDADGISAEGADELCLIQGLSRQRDASGVITRLYPFTADGIDLLLTTRSAPAGYTLVKGAAIPGQPWATASYLQRSSTLGVIEGWARFQDVAMQQDDSYLLHPEMASNALFDRALEYLRTHGAPQAFYDLTVAQVPTIILPGSTIDVVYHEYIDGYHAVDIDTVADGEPLVILASTLEVDNSGAVTTALEVATIDRQAASDASVIAGSIRELRRIQGTTGGLSSYTTIHREVSGTAAITGGVITGVTIDNSPIGQLAPSTGAFTAIAVTNDIAVGGTVDGVDISAHAASDSAHHSPVTVGNTGLSITGQQVSLRLATVSGLEISSGLRLADSIAGAGLTIASKVLAVGAGDGIRVGADTVAVRLASPAGLSFSGGALQLDDTVAGAGLGIANKVLAVGAGDGIRVGADTVAVRLASPAGLSFSGGALQLDDTVAGAGLAINAKVLGIDLATNSGLELSGSPAKLRLRTPSSLDATTANTVTDVLGHTHKVTTGSARGLSASTVNAEGTGAALARADHGHAITAYSDLATYPGQLAKADASGDSRWHRIDLTDRLRAPLIDSATGQGLTIAPDEDLSLSPVSGVVKATSGVAIGSDHYVSQMTGWRTGYDGGADFRYLYADELHAKSFITDLEQALAGGQIIAKSVAVVAVDFTVPAAGSAETLIVEDLPGAAGQAVFQAGDVVRLRQFTRSSGSLSIADCWGVVTGYTDNGDGTQRWIFTRSSGAQAGTAAADSTIEAKTLALDYGTSGNGFYEVNAIDGLWAQNSPYAQVVTWTTHPQSGQVVRSRWGNLKGIFAQADDFGLYAAVAGHTDADQYLRISSLGAVLHNLPLELYSAGDKVLALDPAGPSLALGNPIPTGWLTQTGFWAGNDGGTYKHYVGQVSGGALVKGASWDGQSYNVVGNLIVGPGVGYVVDNALLHLPFDGPVPYEQDVHVDLSGHLGQKPTVATGGIIGRPGRFGKAVQLAEGTTNLVTNPSFEVDTGGWTYYSMTYARSTEWAKFGSASVKITGEANNGYLRTNNLYTVPNGGTVTAQAWVNTQAGGLAFALRIMTGSTERAAAYASGIGEEWLTCSWTNDTGADQAVRVWLYDRGVAAGQVAYFDGVQLEAKAYPTPYCDGSLGPGHAWTGTPHASASTRTATILRYASAGLSGRRGTWAFWVATEHTAPRYWFILDARDGSNADAPLLSFIPGPKIRFYSNQSSRIEAPVTLTAGEYNHCVLTYDYEDDKYYLYWNGVLVGQSTDALATPSWAPNVTVGVNYGGDGNWLNGYLDDLLILDRALTADEVRQLYTSGRPVTVTGSPHSLLLTGPGRGKVEGHAGGIFGWDGAAQPMWGFCTEDGVSFGGATLNAGDALIGDVAGGNYIQWDASAKKLTVRGTIVVQAGSSGISNLSDAGALATKDQVGSADVTFNYAGSTSKGGNANDTDNVSGTAASTIKSGAVRANAGLDSSGYVSRVIRGAAIAGGSAATGLNLTADYLGYYDGTAFRTYLDKNGNFLFSSPGGASLLWSASAGKLQGRDSSNNVQWETDATTGAIVAGAGTVRLDGAGVDISSVAALTFSYSSNKLATIYQRSTTELWLNLENSSCSFSVGHTSSAQFFGIFHEYAKFSNSGNGLFRNTRVGISSLAPADLTVYGGLNLGTATGAGAGAINSTGSANVLQWVLKNARATDPALVQLGVLDSADKGVFMGRRDANDATYTGYGAAGDAFVYTGSSGRGLNIVVPDATNGILRIFVGTSAASLANANMTLLKSGRVLIGTTTDDGVNMLQVNGGIAALANWVYAPRLIVPDGIGEPATSAGNAQIYVDSSTGDLMVKFGDGKVKTIVTDS